MIGGDSWHSSQGLRRYLTRNDARGVPSAFTAKIDQMVSTLIAASNEEEIATPAGWRLHRLSGDRVGTYSMRASGNWRLTFRVVDNAIADLDLEDYH